MNIVAKIYITNIYCDIYREQLLRANTRPKNPESKIVLLKSKGGISRIGILLHDQTQMCSLREVLSVKSKYNNVPQCLQCCSIFIKKSLFIFKSLISN